MNLPERFWLAVHSARAADAPDDAARLPDRLAEACVRVLPVAGAGISLFTDDFRVPLGSSSPMAGLTERLQFTIGEGPCLQAHLQTSPLRADAEKIKQQWPTMFGEMVGRTPFRSIISVPLLRLAPGRGGAIDLYFRGPENATTFDVSDAVVVADHVGAALAIADAPSLALAPGLPGPAWLNGPTARGRRRVWVAVGLLNVRLQLDAKDSLALMRAYAYGAGRVLDEVAADIVLGTLPLDNLQP